MNYKKNSDLLMDYLNLERNPVATKIFMNKDDFDNYPIKLSSTVLPYCVFVAEASLGRSYKVTIRNQGCGGGSRALHFVEVPERVINGTHFNTIGVYKDKETGKDAVSKMHYISNEIYGIAIEPLSECAEDPDVIIIFGKAFQIMRLVQTYAFRFGFQIQMAVNGIQGVCNELTSRVYETGVMNISLFCSGSRFNCNFSDSEMGIGIPFNQLQTLIDDFKSSVNSFERDHKKKEIFERLKEHSFDTEFIKFDSNYDDGLYSYKEE